MADGADLFDVAVGNLAAADDSYPQHSVGSRRFSEFG